MSACPDPLTLTRAIARGADAGLDAHLAVCSTCRAAWDADVHLTTLARQVPVRMPSADRREELRTAILAAGAHAETPAPRAPVRRRRGWVVGAVAAAAAVLVVGLRLGFGFGRDSAAPQPQANGTIHAHPGARYVASSPPDEIVTLLDGSIDVEVTPLHAGERFRVLTADAELEVHGTAFAVTAQRGHLARVTVRHGLVEVRPHDGPIRMLGAGQSWSAADRTSAAVVPVAPPVPTTAAPMPPGAATTTPADASTTRPVAPALALPAPTPAPTSPPPAAAAAAAASTPTIESTAATSRPPEDVAYDQAWAAMRAERFGPAATAFARVAVLDPDGPLAEDAGYWYAVALARARRREAMTAFRDFLDRYPRSPHAAEASVMLGWILVEADQRTEAARRFRAGLDAPNAAVGASARAGLDTLGVR